MERMGINAAFNSGALLMNGRYFLVVRVEGSDRKSFFALAESPNGTATEYVMVFPIQWKNRLWKMNAF